MQGWWVQGFGGMGSCMLGCCHPCSRSWRRAAATHQLGLQLGCSLVDHAY